MKTHKKIKSESELEYTVFLKKSEIHTNKRVYVVECSGGNKDLLTVSIRKNGKPCTNKKIIIEIDDLKKDPLDKLSDNICIFVQKRAEPLFKHMMILSKIFKESGGDINVILSEFNKIEEEFLGAKTYDADDIGVLMVDPDDFYED